MQSFWPLLILLNEGANFFNFSCDLSKHNLDFSAIGIIFSHQLLWCVNTGSKVKLRDFYVFSCFNEYRKRENHTVPGWTQFILIGSKCLELFDFILINVSSSHHFLSPTFIVRMTLCSPLPSAVLLPLRLCGKDAFTSRVLQVLLRDVKFGMTVSYKRLAEMVGNPRAVRAVGGAMRRNPVSVSWHWLTGFCVTYFI